MTNGRNRPACIALVFMAGFAAAAAACSSPRPDEGTNTNWLCNTDADCTKLGAAAVCTGGVCKSWPACTWPSSLEPADSSSRDVCHAARALLTCGPADGAQEICESDNPTRCPGPPDSLLPCKNECGANEYVAACGGVGPGPVPDPPAGCRAQGAVPAGIGFYCCPCGG